MFLNCHFDAPKAAVKMVCLSRHSICRSVCRYLRAGILGDENRIRRLGAALFLSLNIQRIVKTGYRESSLKYKRSSKNPKFRFQTTFFESSLRMGILLAPCFLYPLRLKNPKVGKTVVISHSVHSIFQYVICKHNFKTY